MSQASHTFNNEYLCSVVFVDEIKVCVSMKHRNQKHFVAKCRQSWDGVQVNTQSFNLYLVMMSAIFVKHNNYYQTLITSVGNS